MEWLLLKGILESWKEIRLMEMYWTDLQERLELTPMPERSPFARKALHKDLRHIEEIAQLWDKPHAIGRVDPLQVVRAAKKVCHEYLAQLEKIEKKLSLITQN